MPSSQVNREELAWAAGVFDGEGNTSYSEKNKSRGYRTPSVHFHLGNTYKTLLERFQTAIYGLGKIYIMRQGDAVNKRAWQLCSGRFEYVQAVLAMLWPFLSEQKRTQAKLALLKYRGGYD